MALEWNHCLVAGSGSNRLYKGGFFIYDLEKHNEQC